MNIVEFAKSLNLSTGTVSRALNDRPEVSQETRRRVLAKAQELGFERNLNARRLVTGSTFLIRLEYPCNTNVLSDRYLFELARGVEEATGAHGYDLLLHLGARRHASPAGTAVDGLVIVASSDMTPADLTRLTGNGDTPAVVIVDTPPLDFSPASYVCLDTLAGTRQAFGLLASLGHRRVGYIGNAHSGDRLRPALPALMADAGLLLDQELAIEAGTTQDSGASAAIRLLSLPVPPTAIFARTDILACGAIQGARQLGRRIPEDVSIVGHDNIEVAALVDPPLTTVSIDISKVAAEAVDLLLDRIGNRTEPSVRRHETHLVVRRSCASAPETTPVSSR